MTDPSNNGPAWARKAQAKTKWGPGIGIVVAVLIGLRLLAYLGALGSHAGDTGPAPTGMSYGGFGAPSREEAATYVRTLDATVDTDGQNFDRDVKATAPPGFLKPEALFRAGGITAAEDTLKRERDVVAKYQALAAKRKADSRAQLGGINTYPENTQRAVAAFDGEIAENAATMQTYWTLQYEVIGREETLVTYLARTRGGWRPAAGRVMFLNTGMSQTYQRDVDALRSTQAQINDLVAQVHARNEQAREAQRTSLGE